MRAFGYVMCVCVSVFIRSSSLWGMPVRAFFLCVVYAFDFFGPMSARAERTACSSFSGCLAARHARGLAPTVCASDISLLAGYLHALKLIGSGCAAFESGYTSMYIGKASINTRLCTTFVPTVGCLRCEGWAPRVNPFSTALPYVGTKHSSSK